MKPRKRIKRNRTKKLTPAISAKTGNQLNCYFGDCKNPAWTEYSLTGYKGTEMVVYVFCSWEHQAAQLREWGEC